MATSQYGLISSDPKKKFATQLAAGAALEDENVDQSQLPTANFSTLPTLQVNSSVGTPQAVRAANVPANFKFTGAYEAANRALAEEESNAALGRRNSIADLDSQYRDVMQKSTRMQDLARTALQENMASRGLTMSGINAQGVGQQETDYNQYLNDIATQRARGLSGIENNYAGLLNQLSRRREGLFYDQQQEEENKRLESERLKAEAAAQQQQAQQQQAMLAQIQAAQESARRAASAAAAAAAAGSFQMPQIGGGGYGGAPSPAQPSQQYKPGEQRITMPNVAQGMNQAGWLNWVHSNLDANASPAAAQAVLQQLMKDQPNGGTPLSDIAWLIQQYPNQATSGGDKQYAAGGGRRF